MDSELPDEFEVKVVMHQGSVLSPILFAVAVMLSQNLPEGVLSELLYTDGLVLISETIVGLRNKLIQ